MSRETRERSRELKFRCRRIVKRTPDLQDIVDADVKYVVLKSDYAKIENNRIIYAECKKIPDKDKWAKPFDFEIVVYEPNCDYFTDEQMDILLEHELRHIGVDFSDDEPKLFIYPHDVEDFDKIINKYGAHWWYEGGDPAKT